MAFPNKSIINHESVSLVWQRALHVCSLPPNRVDARDSTQGRRGNVQKKQLNVANLLTCSGLQVQVSFICNMLVLSLLTYLSIKQLAPVRLSLAPHYYHLHFTITFMHLADAFIQSDLQLHSGYTCSLVHVFPGNRTHNLLRS